MSGRSEAATRVSTQGVSHLAAVEDRLRRAQELGGAFPYEWLARSNTLIVPPGFGTLYGLAASEVATYDSVVARIHPDDRQRSRDAHRRAVETGGRYEQDYRIVLPDGGIRWLLVRGEATRDEAGTPLGLAGVAMDITERKQIELLLRERERELADRNRFIHNVLASSDDCIKILDLDDNLRFMSEGGMRVMEVDDFSRIDGCAWPSLWDGEAGELARAALAAAKEGRSGRFEGFCPTVAGTPRWWDVAVTPILNDQGLPDQILSISRDITERRQAEEALRLSQERLELALAAGNIGTWVWDIPSGIVTADHRLATMFEVEPAVAAAGAPIEHFVTAIHPEDRDRVGQIILEVIAKGGKHEVEMRIQRRDGSIHWLVARGECEQVDGRPVRFPAATVDITELKLAEEARELITRELAHRIKNIFSVINGLISFSARGIPEAQPFAASLRERLTALAQAHDYVRPHGPGSHRPERDDQTVLGLIRSLMEPYLHQGHARFVIEGDDIAIGSHGATALALVLHEQATNAVKYGALSSTDGTVKLTCMRSGETFSLLWSEAGGPEIREKPTRRGFGTQLAAMSVTSQLGGTISHEWAPSGLIMLLQVPIGRLQR